MTLKSRRPSIPTSARPLCGHTANSLKTEHPKGFRLSLMGPVKEVLARPHQWSWPLWKSHLDASPSMVILVLLARTCTARTGPNSARTAVWSTARTLPWLMWTLSSAKSSKKGLRCVVLLKTKYCETISTCLGFLPIVNLSSWAPSYDLASDVPWQDRALLPHCVPVVLWWYKWLQV